MKTGQLYTRVYIGFPLYTHVCISFTIPKWTKSSKKERPSRCYSLNGR